MGRIGCLLCVLLLFWGEFAALKVDSTPPTVTCTPTATTITADKGKTSAIVTWVTASTNEGTVKKEEPAGKSSGDEFEEGVHLVLYTAKDGAGNIGSCHFTFTVEVVRCDIPSFPDNGLLACDNFPPLYGDTCTYSCDAGYEEIGIPDMTCQLDGTIIAGDFFCQAKTCPLPNPPENVVFDPTLDCTDSSNFESVCIFPCAPGFTRTGSRSFEQCQEDQTWGPTPAADCTDAVPPEIENCPESFTIYVGADQKHATLDYVKPTATDNTDGELDVDLIEGEPPGSQLEIDRSDISANQHRIVYTATDSAGLEATVPCSFIVSVVDLMCDPIENQPKLNTSCTKPLYVYGSSCEFNCFSGFELEGMERVVCEKYEDRDEVYWNWGDNEPTRCKIQDCPSLDSPDNGAIACTTIAAGKFCAMSCQSGYDIPATVNTQGTFFCDIAVGWLDDTEVPDCTKQRNPDNVRLSAEFYYNGECSSEETQEQIKQNAITAILDSMFGSVCGKYTECNIENVEVTCGDITGRKKSTTPIVVTFEFVIYFDPDSEQDVDELYTELENQIYDMYDSFHGEFQEGLMDLDELNVVSDLSSLASGGFVLDCDVGLIPSFVTFTCRPCPTGTAYNTDSESCEPCPVGTYQDQDGELACTPCPSGFSTESTGARSIQKCIEKCPVGHASTSGIIPCYSCAVGTYQDATGHMSCQVCPEGTNTTVQGSTSLLDCASDSDVCSEDQCGDYGVCVPNLVAEQQYTCVCADGYSGDFCSVPPNPCDTHACQVGATCVPLSTNNYTCTCNSGYTGRYCEKPIVDGGWGYGEWSLCSKTCGTSSQTRQKLCNNPHPQNGGLDCQGESSEIRQCVLEDCPVCPLPRRPYKGFVQVDDDNGTLTATLTCEVGRLFSDASVTTFTCSQETGHQWSPVVDPVDYPKCTETATPEAAVLTLGVTYDVAEEPENEDMFTEEVTNLANENECIQKGACDIATTVTVNDLASTRRRRATGVTMLVTVIISANFDFESFFTDGQLKESAADEIAEEYFSILNQLENLAEGLQNASSDGSLDIEINGQVFSPTEGSFNLSGELTCAAGMISFNGFCVKCPPGSRGIAGGCVACEKGTYQELEGQVQCTACPDGETTKSYGADTELLCLAEHETSTSPSETGDSGKFNSDDSSEDGINKLVYYVAIPVVILALFAVGAVVVYFCCLSHHRVTPGTCGASDSETRYALDEFAGPVKSAPPNNYETVIPPKKNF